MFFSVWLTLDQFSRLQSQSIPGIKSNDRVLSRDKDFQKKFLKWSENDELSEEYLQSDSKPINFYSIIEHLTNEQFSS